MARPTLVTGPTGLVGSVLVRRLVDAGDPVRLLLRPRSDTRLLGDLMGRAEIVHGDVRDPESLAVALDGARRVYHLAAWVGFPGGSAAERMHAVNVLGTRNVVDAALRAGVERLVHVSSVAALSRPSREEGCLDEDTPWTDSPFNTVYARSKYLAELEVQRAVAEGLDAVIVNPSLVFGVGLPGENTWGIVERVRRNRVPAYPTGATNVVDAEDVAAGMMLAMERGVAGRRYILAGEHLAWRDILGTLARAHGTRVPSRPARPALLAVLGLLSETAARALRRTPRLTREGARVASRSTCYDASKARDQLGWTSRPFVQTAARLAALVVLAFLLPGCAPAERPLPDGHPTLVSTFHAVTLLAREVAGPRADVVTLMEPGVSPHAHEPRPSDLRAVGNAMSGLFAARGVDGWFAELGFRAPFEFFPSVPDSLRRYVSGAADPHFWLSPLAAASTLAPLAEHLCALDREGCAGYRSRADSLAGELALLDNGLRGRLSAAAGTRVVAASSFISYFLDGYGFDTVALVEVVEGVEPSPAHLQDVIRVARGAAAVIGQPTLPENAARAVAEAAGIPYVTADPIGSPQTAPTYRALVERIATTLEEVSRGR